MLTPWKKSYDQSRQHIKKQRHYFTSKGPSSQGYGFSSIQVWMWELDHEESWTLKNWCIVYVSVFPSQASFHFTLFCCFFRPSGCSQISIANSHHCFLLNISVLNCFVLGPLSTHFKWPPLVISSPPWVYWLSYTLIAPQIIISLDLSPDFQIWYPAA